MTTPSIRDLDRILIVRLGALGDVISALNIDPLVPARYETHYLVDISSEIFARIFNSNIHAVSRINKKALLIGLIKFRLVNRNLTFSKIIVLHPSIVLRGFFKFFFPMAEVYGYKYVISRSGKNVTWDVDANSTENFYKVAKLAIQDMEAPGTEKISKFTIPETSNLKEKMLTAFSQKLPIVVASIGAGNEYANGANKAWPVSKWDQLIGLFDGFFVFVGASDAELNAINTLQEAYPLKVLNLVGRLTPNEITWALKNSSVFVGNDSGLLHLAWILGVPNIGLYGPTSYYQCGPGFSESRAMRSKATFANATSDCSECYSVLDGLNSKMYSCLNNVCMQSISAEYVKEKILKLIAKVND